MGVGICTAWGPGKGTGRPGPGAQESNPTNVRRVFGDDEDAQIVRPGISGDEEESDSLRIVSVRSAYQLFPIVKGNLGFAALILRVKFLRCAVLAIANEIPGKEIAFKSFIWTSTPSPWVVPRAKKRRK